MRSAIATGVSQYLVKPFTFQTFADKLERYARYRAQVDRAREADQASVDAMLGTLRAPAAGPTLPKGLNATTLDRVRAVVVEAAAPMTASEVAGASGPLTRHRPPLPRALVVEGDALLLMRYGRTGRPEHLYSRPAG